MKQFVRNLPDWAVHAWIVFAMLVMASSLAYGASEVVTLHRENNVLAREVRVQRESVAQLQVVSEVQSNVLERANRKLKRLGESPVGSPFPFSFSFGVGGTAFRVTCTDPGKDCLVETY